MHAIEYASNCTPLVSALCFCFYRTRVQYEEIRFDSVHSSQGKIAIKSSKCGEHRLFVYLLVESHAMIVCVRRNGHNVTCIVHRAINYNSGTRGEYVVALSLASHYNYMASIHMQTRARCKRRR